MPNWTYNYVEMKGIKKLDIYDKNGNIDFNKIVPEPKTKKECIEKYGERYIDNGDRHLQHSNGDEWFNWYDWHCDYWGTKWNAGDSNVEDDSVSFTTAWAEPLPIWIELSKMCPNVEMKVYADYEEGFTVESIYVNGKCISEIEKEYEYEEDDDDDE